MEVCEGALPVGVEEVVAPPVLTLAAITRQLEESMRPIAAEGLAQENAARAIWCLCLPPSRVHSRLRVAAASPTSEFAATDGRSAAPWVCSPDPFGESD